MDDECRVAEGWTFFTWRWGVCLEIVEGPFFLFALSLIAAEGMEMGRGERGRESIHVGDRIANSMGAFVPVLVRLGGCND